MSAATIVNDLLSQKKIARVISNEPNTNLERYVTADVVHWLIDKKEIKVYFNVHVLNSNGVEIQAFKKKYITVASNNILINPTTGLDVSPENLTGNEIGEYDYLYNLVNTGVVSITNLILAQITKLDNENKFNFN